MIKWLSDLFCKHDWRMHAKETIERKYFKVMPGTEHWFNPVILKCKDEDKVQILICKKCGEIRKLTY